MNGRKKCPIPILEFADFYRESNFGSREELANKMTKDWNEEWSKQDLDQMFESEHEPKGSRVAKVYLSLGLKFPAPAGWMTNKKEA